MPKLPPSKVAMLLGISDKTIVRAVNRGDLRDYQQREPEVALPMRGPKFILVDLAEAHRYFREKGLLGRIAPSPDAEVVSKLMEELGDVKQELATISALVRESRPSYLTARPAPLDARLLLRPAALSSLSDLPVAADSLSSRLSDFSADSGDSEEVTSDLTELRTQKDRMKDRMSASSPVLAFGVGKDWPTTYVPWPAHRAPSQRGGLCNLRTGSTTRDRQTSSVCIATQCLNRDAQEPDPGKTGCLPCHTNYYA